MTKPTPIIHAGDPADPREVALAVHGRRGLRPLPIPWVADVSCYKNVAEDDGVIVVSAYASLGIDVRRLSRYGLDLDDVLDLESGISALQLAVWTETETGQVDAHTSTLITSQGGGAFRAYMEVPDPVTEVYQDTMRARPVLTCSVSLPGSFAAPPALHWQVYVVPSRIARYATPEQVARRWSPRSGVC